MKERKSKKQIGINGDEAGKDGKRRGRPPGPPLTEEKKKEKREEKNRDSVAYRANKKADYQRLQGMEKRYKAFGIPELEGLESQIKRMHSILKAFCEHKASTPEEIFKAMQEQHVKFVQELQKTDEVMSLMTDFLNKFRDKMLSQFSILKDMEKEMQAISGQDIRTTEESLQVLEERQGKLMQQLDMMGKWINDSEDPKLLKKKKKKKKKKKIKKEEPDEARKGKEPISAGGTPPHFPTGGSCPAYGLDGSWAPFTQGPPFSGIERWEAAHDKEASTSRAPRREKLRKIVDEPAGAGSKKRKDPEPLLDEEEFLTWAERVLEDLDPQPLGNTISDEMLSKLSNLQDMEEKIEAYREQDRIAEESLKVLEERQGKLIQKYDETNQVMMAISQSSDDLDPEILYGTTNEQYEEVDMAKPKEDAGRRSHDAVTPPVGAKLKLKKRKKETKHPKKK